MTRSAENQPNEARKDSSVAEPQAAGLCPKCDAPLPGHTSTCPDDIRGDSSEAGETGHALRPEDSGADSSKNVKSTALAGDAVEPHPGSAPDVYPERLIGYGEVVKLLFGESEVSRRD